jgi:ankyrin repeat protein
MKKLLLFSLLSLSVVIPAVAMQSVNVPTTHTPGLYMHPTVSRFTGADAPTGSSALHIIHDSKPEIVDYDELPSNFTINPALAQQADTNGRTALWWAAVMGKKNLYNQLVKIGADPKAQSTKGILAGFSAEQIMQMSPEEKDALIEAGPDATTAKL